MKRSVLTMCAAAVLVGVSCERQNFDGPDGTRKLHEHHGSAAHDHAHDAAHGHGDDAKSHSGESGGSGH